MTVNTTIYGLLSGASDVAALVGTRIIPGVAKESTDAPRITYQTISDLPYSLLAGGSNGKKARVQVNCWATTRSGADDLAAKAKTALEASGYIVGGIDDYDAEAQLHVTRFDWSVITS